MSAVFRAVLALILAALEWWGSVDGALPSPVGASPHQSRPDDGDHSDVTNAAPIAPGREQAAAVFALLRAVDPCGLHDVAAATRVTGDRGDEIMPEESLSACRLRLRGRPFEPTWTFTIRVGTVFSASDRHAAASEQIDGRQLYWAQTPYPRRSCVYTRPFGSEWGISLTVQPPTGEPSAQPCRIAKAYLLASRSLTRLVLRAEKRTEPSLPLASIDPCAATTDVLGRLGTPGAADPQAPYECRIQPDSHDTGASSRSPVTITYGVTTDPGELVNASTRHLPVTVQGRTGVAISGVQMCQLVVPYDNRVTIHIDRTRWMQTVAIQAASCDQATVVADIVLTKIVTH